MKNLLIFCSVLLNSYALSIDVDLVIAQIKQIDSNLIEECLPYKGYPERNFIENVLQSLGNSASLEKQIKKKEKFGIKSCLYPTTDKIRVQFIRASQFTNRIISFLTHNLRFGGVCGDGEIAVHVTRKQFVEIQTAINKILELRKNSDPLKFLIEIVNQSDFQNSMTVFNGQHSLLPVINAIKKTIEAYGNPLEEAPMCDDILFRIMEIAPLAPISLPASRVDVATDAADSGRAEEFANRIMAILTRGFRFGGNLLEDETEIRVTQQQFAQIQENMDKIFQLRESQNALNFLNADTWDDFIGSLEQNQEAMLRNTDLIRNVLRAYGGGEELPNDRYAVFRFVIGEGKKSSVDTQTAAEIITTPKKPAGRKSPSSSPRAGSSKSSSAGRSEISNLSRTDQKNDKRID
ncbi:MAG: hypothetical protein LBQ08_02520, partial [Holosporaceae bacterium]|nr:hypothetical protein [Holosporaceae bacterium]